MQSIRVDFIVTSTPYILSVSDTSKWGPIANKATIIEIVRPGYTEPSTFYFEQGKNNIYNSNLLGANCQDCGDLVTMTDGIYKITVKGSPDSQFKEDYYLKTDLFEMELDKLLVYNLENDNYTESFKFQFSRVEFLLKSAEAHMRCDNVRKASDLFQLAESELEDLKNCYNV